MKMYVGPLLSGQEITVDDYNRLAAALNHLQQQLAGLARPAAEDVEPQLTAAPPLEVRRRPGGWHLSMTQPQHTALVELTADLSIGSSATAKVLWYQGSAWTDADTAEIVVHDALGTFEGNSGSKALVAFDRQSGQWIVWQLQC